jgi:hypothetical protein
MWQTIFHIFIVGSDVEVVWTPAIHIVSTFESKRVAEIALLLTFVIFTPAY